MDCIYSGTDWPRYFNQSHMHQRCEGTWTKNELVQSAIRSYKLDSNSVYLIKEIDHKHKIRLNY